MNADVRQSKSATPYSQGVLDGANWNSLITFRQEESGIVIGSAGKVISVLIQRYLVYEKGPALIALSDNFPWATNLFISAGANLHVEADGAAVERAHLADSQARRQKQAD